MATTAVRHRRRIMRRGVAALVFGLFLGGLFTKLAEVFLPQSATRAFLTTSVSLSVGPFFLDLVSVSVTLGPVSVALNVISLMGILIAAVAVRSWI